MLEDVILLPALVPVELLAHHSVHRFVSRYLSYLFTLFIALLHIVTFCEFSLQVLRYFIALLSEPSPESF